MTAQSLVVVWLRGAAFAAPVIIASAAVPAYASSQKVTTGEQGLFVSTQKNGGFIGYSGSNQSAADRPTTPTAYFAAGGTASSDLNWNDATNSPTRTDWYTNGEGSFTPVTNGPTGSGGSYASTSGFWGFAPTTDPNTGTGYISGSTATLVKGSTFVTEVELVVPKDPNGTWTTQNVTISGRKWTGAMSGPIAAQSASATYLSTGGAGATWSITAPNVVDNGDGTLTMRGTITATTTADARVTQSGTKYYGQQIIMPATVQVNTSYGWNSFTLTSRVQNATINYTVPASAGTAPAPTVLTNSLIISSTLRP